MSDRHFHLFVYGTLRGRGADGELLGECERVRAAALNGTLYDIRGEYPALLLYGDTRVPGEIWKCPNRVLPRLDAYEDVRGRLFRRVGVEVGDLGCWAYVAGPGLARELSPNRRLRAGDWPPRE